MLQKLSFLSFLSFGVLYPLCFWISYKDPIKNNFLRFHLGCPVLLSGLAIIGSFFIPIGLYLKVYSIIWLLLALIITAYSWNKENVNLLLITLLSILGISLYCLLYSELVGFNSKEILISILGGLILSIAFYVMNLGHFYLNVHGLKTYHLKNAMKIFLILLIIRLVWNVYGMFSFQMIYAGEMIKLSSFILTVEGVFLIVALFFGILFPLMALYFAFETLKLKNTQATTGILYVILSGILLGDLTYKYYLMKYSIPL